MLEPAPALDAAKIAREALAADFTRIWARTPEKLSPDEALKLADLSCGLPYVEIGVRAALDAVAGAFAVKPLEDGIKRAAAWVQTRLDDYVSEHGSYDPSTGATEFPGNGDEYVYKLEEIIEGLSALVAAPPAAREDHPCEANPVVSHETADVIDKAAPPAEAGLLPIWLEGGLGYRVSKAMHAYLADYVFGMEYGPDHDPTEFERAMLEDFLAGAFGDEVNAILQEAARAMAALAARDADVARLREALTEEKYWHERDDKALSKSGRGDADYYWRRNQHREQIEAIDAALIPVTRDAGGE